jgi:hypothetical protein
MKKLNTTTLALVCLATLSSQSVLGMDIEKKKITIKKYTPKSTKSSPENFRFEDSGRVVKFKSLPWAQLEPHLNHLVEEVINDPSYESRTLCFQVKREDWEQYRQWEDGYRNKCRYPIGYSSSSHKAEGERVNGIYEIYHKEFSITNATKKEEEARNIFSYRFFEGKFDESRINPQTFYNLVVRAEFTKDDFEKGKYGYQDRIFVKPIRLKQETAPLCDQEIQEAIESNLKKAFQPYIVFVFELPKNAKFKVQDLGRTHHEPLATIIEENERHLYVCFSNNKRNILDLHEMSYEEGFKKVKSFLQERYTHYDKECDIITGRGNHENSNGTRGVMSSSFPKWMKSEEISPLIERYIQKNGLYTVFLKKPMKCDLTSLHLQQDPFEVISNALRKVITTRDLRLRIKGAAKNFDHKLIHFLCIKEPELSQDISPYSIKTLPGELRLNLRHRTENSTEISGPIISFTHSGDEIVKMPSSNEISINNNSKNKKKKKNKNLVKSESIRNNPQKSVIQKERIEENPRRKECIRTIGKNGKLKFEFKNLDNK